MKNGDKNKSVAFIILVSVYIYIYIYRLTLFSFIVFVYFARHLVFLHLESFRTLELRTLSSCYLCIVNVANIFSLSLIFCAYTSTQS